MCDPCRRSGRPAGLVEIAASHRRKNSFYNAMPGAGQLLELIPKLKGPLFMSKRPNGEARGGSIPAVVCDRRATKPVGLLLINPQGGIAFGGRRRWPVAYSPLRGCARRAALPAAKSDCRRGPFNLRISSNSTLLRLLLQFRQDGIA